MEQIYIPKQDYKVLVRCFTYNQSKYIEDALNGFAMQQTEFPFVCLVMDDCSTDGEQEVIKAWMERECDMVEAEYIELELSNVILLPHKTNPTCSFAFYLLKQNLWREGALKHTLVTPWRVHCEYEALCEGDDYWISPVKLQKQVEFLDTNKDFAMCYSPCYRFYQDTKTLTKDTFGGDNELFEDFVRENTVPTPTILMRQSMYVKYFESINPYARNWLMGDYPMWLYFSHEYKVKCMKDEIFSVYRVLENSASHSSDITKFENFIINTTEIVKFFTDYFNEPNLYDPNATYRYLFSNAVKYGNKEKAKEYFQKVDHPSLKMRLKYFIIQNDALYSILKGKMFYTLDK